MSLSGTIQELRKAFEKQIEQATGKKDKTSFLDTLGDYDSLDDLLEKLFDTQKENDEWVSIKGSENKSELKDGIRLRLIVAYLCMWKKALLKACSTKTDVDAILDGDVAFINTGIQALEITDRVLAESKS